MRFFHTSVLAFSLSFGVPLAFGTGCSSAPSYEDLPQAGTLPLPRTSSERDVISTDEIADFLSGDPGSSAYEIVAHRRRRWLNSRAGASDFHGLTVFNGPLPLGGVGALRNIHLANVARLTYVSPRTAAARFGRSQPVSRGAIVVSYR